MNNMQNSEVLPEKNNHHDEHDAPQATQTRQPNNLKQRLLRTLVVLGSLVALVLAGVIVAAHS